MCPPVKVNGVWPFNDAWLRTSLEEARRQAPRNVASILDSARELRIRDGQVSEGKGDSNPDGLAVAGVQVWSNLGGCDVLGARALRALAERKRHAVAFAE